MRHWRRNAAILGCLVSLAAAAPQGPAAVIGHIYPGYDGAAPVLPRPTLVLSERDAARLRGLEGITLQWINWDKRGVAAITIDDAGVWRLYGEQSGANAAGLVVDGRITEIGRDYFLLEGAVTIVNTPDEGRTCEGYGTWRFAVTQARKYYRLRQFEWCDGLTDYVDLYF